MYSGFHWVQEHSCTCGTVSLEWTLEVPRVWREVKPFLTRSFLFTSSAPSPKRFKLLEVGMKWELLLFCSIKLLFSRDSRACTFGSPFCFRFATSALFQKRRLLFKITFCFIAHIQWVVRLWSQLFWAEAEIKAATDSLELKWILLKLES